MNRPPIALLHAAQYALDQFLLIFGTGEEDCSTKPFNQQINNFDIHFPGIGTRWHAASWMHYNQRFVGSIAIQYLIDMHSSVSRHLQNEIKVPGGEANGSHQFKPSLDLVY